MLGNEDVLLARDIFQQPEKYNLTPREHFILLGRLIEGMTFEEVGQSLANRLSGDMGVCRDRARFIYHTALRKLRMVINTRFLKAEPVNVERRKEAWDFLAEQDMRTRAKARSKRLGGLIPFGPPRHPQSGRKLFHDMFTGA